MLEAGTVLHASSIVILGMGGRLVSGPARLALRFAAILLFTGAVAAAGYQAGACPKIDRAPN